MLTGRATLGAQELVTSLTPSSSTAGRALGQRTFSNLFTFKSNQPCHLSCHCQHLPLCHHHPGEQSSWREEEAIIKRTRWRFQGFKCQLYLVSCHHCAAGQPFALLQWIGINSQSLSTLVRYLGVNRRRAGCCSRRKFSSLCCQVIEESPSSPVGEPDNGLCLGLFNTCSHR